MGLEGVFMELHWHTRFRSKMQSTVMRDAIGSRKAWEPYLLLGWRVIRACLEVVQTCDIKILPNRRRFLAEAFKIYAPNLLRLRVGFASHE